MTLTEFGICNYCKKPVAIDVKGKLVFHMDQIGNNCPNCSTILWSKPPPADWEPKQIGSTPTSPAMPQSTVAE